mmetsp:Transcript_29356/g.44275  ORF Transcript_29356/g.44275 Transcript_29356/m.44275 type:complete len:112 (-) Transcript_29356:8407-8742(-)
MKVQSVLRLDPRISIGLINDTIAAYNRTDLIQVKFEAELTGMVGKNSDFLHNISKYTVQYPEQLLNLDYSLNRVPPPKKKNFIDGADLDFFFTPQPSKNSRMAFKTGQSSN